MSGRNIVIFHHSAQCRNYAFDLIWRNFCEKIVAVKFCNFLSVHTEKSRFFPSNQLHKLLKRVDFTNFKHDRVLYVLVLLHTHLCIMNGLLNFTEFFLPICFHEISGLYWFHGIFSVLFFHVNLVKLWTKS